MYSHVDSKCIPIGARFSFEYITMKEKRRYALMFSCTLTSTQIHYDNEDTDGNILCYFQVLSHTGNYDTNIVFNINN